MSDDFETVPTGTMRELERLRELVETAYMEGLMDAESRGELTDEQCWLHSQVNREVYK